ncbi:MAG TPA: A24 family peptidase [Balneolales bacterium]|nr:A24 family peptidase [Balneolales bacterium]
MHELIIYTAILTIIAAATLFDLNRHIIPNQLIIVGLALWIILFVIGWLDGPEDMAAGVAAGSLLLGIRWLGEFFFSKKGMGMGDIKLLFLIGLYLGWQVFWFLYLAIIIGGLWALAGLVLKKLQRTSRIAFAPFLFVGMCLGLTLLPFHMIWQWWMR